MLDELSSFQLSNQKEKLEFLEFCFDLLSRKWKLLKQGTRGVVDMKFFKLGAQSCSAADFVHFWSKCYDEGKYMDLDYDRSISAVSGLSTLASNLFNILKTAFPIISFVIVIACLIYDAMEGIQKFNDAYNAVRQLLEKA
jgi:hypothetical protein